MGKPVRLTPSLREKVWGRTRLAPWFPDSEKPIGEAWYLAEHELPLLVKLIFTSERLSIQVHPDDGEGVERGKNEMHHVLEAEPGASIALGFREPITRERLAEATRTGEIERLMKWFPVKPGETYFTPAHTVHAIGAGVVLCEIQQNCDVTYRLWDYGRPREVHVDEALPISDLGIHPGAVSPAPVAGGRHLLVRSRHFVTHLILLRAGDRCEALAGRCPLWIVLEGSGYIGDEPAKAGEVWLLPENGVRPVLRAETEMRVLETHAPA